MLSVVVVGRNDNHGYNLGKRVASSLNSISMRLRDGDELIFVDWNTPRPFPPMPVSIIDDLTEQTKKFLRILVVDPKVHDEVKGDSSKMILEPFARNVGIRRAKTQNKWILSTNTDILFIGEEDLSFQDLIGQLDDRLWQSFRYEIPEYIWEVLDKRDPQSTNEIIRKLSDTTPIRLNLTTSPAENIKEKFIFADAIGDFQLAPREMWESIRGFPEDMLDGWHVDSRAAVQMIRDSRKESKVLHKECGLSTYHQNHLRTLTHFHTSASTNGVDLIAKPYLNNSNWGLSNLNVTDYEIRIDVTSLIKSSFATIDDIPEVQLQEIHRNMYYDLGLASIFILDEVKAISPKESVSLMTANPELTEYLLDLSNSLDFNLQIVNPTQTGLELTEAFTEASLVILDFGVVSVSKRAQVENRLTFEINVFVSQYAKYIPVGKRVLAIRAQNWAIRTLLSYYFSLPLFNNYGGTLAGNRIHKNFGKNQIKETFLKACIHFEFVQSVDRSALGVKIYKAVRGIMPIQIRSIIRRILLK